MKQFFPRFRDPISGVLHVAGFLLSIAAFVVLETYSVTHGTLRHIAAFAVYGTSLLMLYGASSMYHLLPLSPRGIILLRRIDHAMIYILIAGTYTPLCLLPLHGVLGWRLFAVIWSMAIAGIFQALFWIHAPRWFSTSLYLVMGWMALIAFPPLVHSIPLGGILWLVLGGLSYTGGAIIYAFKRPNPVPGVFGFHEIWHLVVLVSSFCHFWVMLKYVMIIS